MDLLKLDSMNNVQMNNGLKKCYCNYNSLDPKGIPIGPSLTLNSGIFHSHSPVEGLGLCGMCLPRPGGL